MRRVVCAALGNKAALVVAAVAEAAPGLEVLELSCCDITAAGAARLAPCLARMTALKRLVLAENELNERGIFPLPSRDGSTRSVYSRSPHAMGPRGRYIPAPLARWVHTVGIFPLPSRDWRAPRAYAPSRDDPPGCCGRPR